MRHRRIRNTDPREWAEIGRLSRLYGLYGGNRADRAYREGCEHLDAYFSVSGIRALFIEMQERGAEVIMPLEERPWACLDFYVKDPDGHVLCFSEPTALHSGPNTDT
jgi:predicted enzyme related to lactoylglutathione lyase